MAAGLARLKAAPALAVGNAKADIRRAHRTTVPRAGAPAIHWIDGVDEPARDGAATECTRLRRKYFTVSVFGRSDLGVSAIDALVDAVNNRLNPFTTGYGDGVMLYQRGIAPETEIADTDATRVDMEFWFEYLAPDAWSL